MEGELWNSIWKSLTRNRFNAVMVCWSRRQGGTFRRHQNISTQPTWSHSALYGEPMAGVATEEELNVLCEANIDDGVVSAPLSKYLHCQTHLLNDHRLLVNKSGD
jgi:hypothetical protein